MATDEDETTIDETDTSSSSLDYIDVIKNLQENTVKKEEYLKLQEENRKLLQSLINGEKIEDSVKPGENIDPKEVVNHILENLETGSTMQGIEDILKLVDYDKAHGLPHPFLSLNNKSPDEEDIRRAEKVEGYLRDCLSYADGDKYLFAQELSRGIEDSPFVKIRK